MLEFRCSLSGLVLVPFPNHPAQSHTFPLLQNSRQPWRNLEIPSSRSNSGKRRRTVEKAIVWDRPVETVNFLRRALNLLTNSSNAYVFYFGYLHYQFSGVSSLFATSRE